MSKMRYCYQQGKGILNKPVKVFVHKGAKYPAVLKKIKEEVYSDTETSQKTVPWSISTYMSMANIKYQSKLRLYCVLWVRHYVISWSHRDG